MASIVVTYPIKEGAKFDQDYYAKTHVPLAQKTWEPHGLSSAEILFPVDGDQPYAAMVVLRFPSQAAIDAAMSSPGTPAVLADVPNFTDIQPAVYRSAD